MTTLPRYSLMLLALWVAATFSTSAWAVRDLVKVDNHVDYVPLSSTHIGDEAATEVYSQPRMIPGDQITAAVLTCSPQEISIAQHRLDKPGISEWVVQIINTSELGMRNIIVNCGTFTSASFIDPAMFHRIGGGPTCIVNNGHTMLSHQTINFSYQQSFIQPLSMASAECVP